MSDSADEWTVRPYYPDDGAALWELKAAFERELGALGGDEKATTYEEKLDDEYRERYRSWVDRCVEREPCVRLAVADGDPVGYVFLLPERHAMIWDAAVVNELYVRPEYRGTGLAAELFEAGLEHAAEQDLPLDRVVLDVDPDNDRAGAFYERFGFEPWGELVARPL